MSCYFKISKFTKWRANELRFTCAAKRSGASEAVRCMPLLAGVQKMKSWSWLKSKRVYRATNDRLIRKLFIKANNHIHFPLHNFDLVI
jgi:hypothetical protein